MIATGYETKPEELLTVGSWESTRLRLALPVTRRDSWSLSQILSCILQQHVYNSAPLTLTLAATFSTSPQTLSEG